MITAKWTVLPTSMTKVEYDINKQLFTIVPLVVAEINKKLETVYDDPAYWMDVQ